MPRGERRALAAHVNQRLTYIPIVAVQNGLVAPRVLANVREGLDDAQTELLALLALVDGDVLDVSNAAEPAEELAFDEDGADGDDAVAHVVDDDDRVVRRGRGAHGVELVHPGVFAKVLDDGEDGEDVKVTAFVVCGCERADLLGRVSM